MTRSLHAQEEVFVKDRGSNETLGKIEADF